MNRTWLPLIITCMMAVPASSQTLFTYGDQSVSAADFVRAFNKNNTQPMANKTQAMKEYLDLYINSRLKIREAYQKGFDTLPQIRAEVDNLRNQIIESYMSDPETMDRLVKEAFERSKKDIHVGHIFIPLTNNDTTATLAAAKAIHARLVKGEDFPKLAAEVSKDPAASHNKGDIGWITVFTLPYPFENAVYALAPGKISSPVRSKLGYHIFKNIGERKALGKMKAKQILLAFPPGSDDAAKKQIALKADSLYKRIIAGDDFGKLATAFSNDYVTAISGGSMPDFGVGQYDPVFESKVWALTKNGAVTKPFMTAHGYHIVQRGSIVPVVTDPANKTNEQELRRKINMDQRWRAAREVVLQKIRKQVSFQRAAFDNASLYAFTDSMIDGRPINIGRIITKETTLYTIGDSTITAANWLLYVPAYRYRSDGTGRKTYDELMDEYTQQIIFKYYRDHLEKYNDDFRYQMSEFRDGNLFFEIMQQEIWSRAHTDTAELKALYETNKSKYNWSKSADAVIFFCSDQAVAKTLYEQLKKNPARWREISEPLSEKVVADSSRYEWTQIPNKNKMVPVNGMLTSPIVNTTDNTSSFAYIIKTYPQPTSRSFAEAKGLVINDYQNLLEEQWVKELRKKYPVKIDEKVWESISR
ncbi:MAG TPA: peptidylprolyl isomerase [Chitinophagaceae bacterium]|nr:peptidylprolyl isomerase [Chitinophagaceae bacterium]